MVNAQGQSQFNQLNSPNETFFDKLLHSNDRLIHGGNTATTECKFVSQEKITLMTFTMFNTLNAEMRKKIPK